jgi:crossover junction endodeoxyribonuclease RuvC
MPAGNLLSVLIISIKSPMNIILGVDPGIADTGYGLIEENNNELKLIAYGSIKTSKTDCLANRLAELEKQLSVLVAKHQPTVAVIEQLFFCNNAKTALIVGQARGVILLSLAKTGIKIIELTPLQVKQGLTGYGAADKKQVQQMVKLILKLSQTPKPDDAADALAMAICGANMCRINY